MRIQLLYVFPGMDFRRTILALAEICNVSFFGRLRLPFATVSTDMEKKWKNGRRADKKQSERERARGQTFDEKIVEEILEMKLE